MNQERTSEAWTSSASDDTTTLPGQSTFECFAAYDPASSRWNTAQTAMPWGSDEFSEAWPKMGTMRSGVCSAPPMSARPSGESASTSSPGDLYPGTSERLQDALQEWGPRGEKMKLNPDWVEALCGLRSGFTDGLPRPKRRSSKIAAAKKTSSKLDEPPSSARRSDEKRSRRGSSSRAT